MLDGGGGCVKGLLQFVERVGEAGELLGVTDKVEMGVDIVAEEISGLLNEERGKMTCPILDTGGTKSPFKVGELIEAGTFGEEGSVGDTGSERIVGAAEEAHHGVDAGSA